MNRSSNSRRTSANLEELFGRTNPVGLLKTQTATTPLDQNSGCINGVGMVVECFDCLKEKYNIKYTTIHTQAYLK